MRGRRVAGGRKPTACRRVPSRFACVLRVAGHLVLKTGGEIDLSRSALLPRGGADVGEEDLEVLRLTRGDVDERRLASVGGVVARHSRGRHGCCEHAECERSGRDRGSDLSHVSFLVLFSRWMSARWSRGSRWCSSANAWDRSSDGLSPYSSITSPSSGLA